MAMGELASDLITGDVDTITMEYNMGANQTGTHVAIKDTKTEVWSGYSSIKTELEGGEVFTLCQQSLLDTLNKL
jgi:hypothetical protein